MNVDDAITVLLNHHLRNYYQKSCQHNKVNLMNELAKINRVIDRELPGATRENFLVLDATTGQNAVQQAKEFRNAAALTGLILTFIAIALDAMGVF